MKILCTPSRNLLCTPLLLLLAGSAYGWGVKGHMMCGRVAAQALPQDAPLFFRSASERLAYLIPEPDRWRGEAWGGHSGPRQELTNLTAGNHNIRMELLELHELAALAKGRVQLMIDTKEPSHSEAFYSEMEKALRDNGLLEGAFFIRTEESRSLFKGKSRVGLDRRNLKQALDNREAVSRLYFLFEHGRTLDQEGLDLAACAGVPAVVSINVFHYADKDHWKGAEADVRRLRKLGMTYFQIDSIYDKWLLQ